MARLVKIVQKIQYSYAMPATSLTMYDADDDTFDDEGATKAAP